MIFSTKIQKIVEDETGSPLVGCCTRHCDGIEKLRRALLSIKMRLFGMIFVHCVGNCNKVLMMIMRQIEIETFVILQV